MKEVALSILIVAFFVAATFVVASAQAGPEEHQHGTVPPAAEMPAEMMQQMLPHMKQKMERGREAGHKKMGTPCVPGKKSLAGRLEMMTCMLSGRMEMSPETMQGMMDRAFYLDRSAELGLTAEQVEKLKAIRAACRKDNIRTAADLRIARLDMDDLLDGSWRVEDAEKLIRSIKKLEGDIQVRHLLAEKEAEKVLTAEQLKKASAAERVDESLEALLQ